MKSIYFLLVLTCTYSVGQNNRQTDSLALVDIFQSTNGVNWRTSWDIENTPINEWHGVTVQNQRVIELDLSSNNLVGTLTENIGDLDKLENLYLLFNFNLRGSIPAELGKCVSLKKLDLSFCAFDGNIPTDLGKLVNLELLKLSVNKFNGELPTELGELSNLHTFDVTSNELSGGFPSFIQRLEKLEYLDLSTYKMSAPIPSWIGDMVTLKDLRLEGSNLNGNIPEEIGQLKRLNNLVLSSNNLEGRIPASLKNLDSLISLNLRYNKLVGSIPIELGDLSSLRILNLSFNQLAGEVPPELGELKELEFIAINSNKLGGAIPQSLAQIDKLGTFYGFENRFTRLPDFTRFVELNRSFMRFWFSNNQLPFSEIIKNISLNDENEFLYQNQNIDRRKSIKMNLGDTIRLSPSDTTEGNNYLWFKDNKPIYDATSFTYEIIYDTESEGHYFCEITNNLVKDLFIDFDGYYLYDTINSPPTDLNLSNYWLPQDSTSVQFISKIDVSDKDLSDAHEFYLVDNDLDEGFFYISSDSLFSRSAFNFQNQQEYRLRLGVKDSSLATYEEEINLFVDGGRQMDSLALLAMYQSLDGENWKLKWDIENEPITNWIGVYLNENNRVQFVRLRSFNLSGNLPDEVGRLRFLYELDLTGNSIIGEIPKDIQFCKSLSRLRLGSNEMAGNIPAELGNLEELFRLDLSDNHFSGSVPSEFEQLLGLTDLFLQYNQITDIPRLSRLRLRHSYGDLQLHHNRLGFTSIIRNIGVENFNYFNQTLDEPVMDTVEYGQTYTLAVSEATDGTSYQWFKDYTQIEATERTYSFTFDTESEGTYSCEMTHPNVPNLVIQREEYYLNDFNFYPPTGIRLLGDSILENQESGILIGELLADDLDSVDNHNFKIINEDSASFHIIENQLYSSLTFNYEDRSGDGYSLVYELNIEVRDQTGEWFQADDIYVRVIDVNEPPTDILLNNLQIDEGITEGSFVGLLETNDPDFGDAHAYDLKSITGFFQINDDSLFTASPINFEEIAVHEILISSKDIAGNILEKMISVEVIDKNDSPSEINLSEIEIEENQPRGTLIGILESIDEDFNDSHSYDIINGSENFMISEDSLISLRSFDFENEPLLKLEIATSDQRGGRFEKQFPIKVIDMDDLVTATSKGKTLSVYPNPAVDVLNLETWTLDFIVEILDLSGRVILRSKGQSMIDVKHLTSGLYYVKFIDGNRLHTIKFHKD